MLPNNSPPCQIQTERSLVWIFSVLSRARRSSDCASTVRIPDTLFYQHGSLRLWFSNDDSGAANGEIMRRDKRDCTTERIIEVLGAAAAPGAVCDGIRHLGLPVGGKLPRRRRTAADTDDEGPLPEAPPHLPVAAYYVYKTPSSSPSIGSCGAATSGHAGGALRSSSSAAAGPSGVSAAQNQSQPSSPARSATAAAAAALRKRAEYRDVAGEELDTLEVHYMDRSGLILFLEQSRAPRHNAVLQRFPHGRNPKHTTAEVIWTPHQTLVTLRQNLHTLTDASVSLFDRCCTNEAAAHLSREVKATPQIVQLLSAECGAIVGHIVGVEGRQVLRMVLCFAFDELRRPTLLHASEVQLTLLPMPAADAKAGLARSYTRHLMHIAPANVNGLKSILSAGGGLTEEDATGMLKGRARTTKLKFTQRQSVQQAIEHVRDVDRFEASYVSMGGVEAGLRRDPRYRDVPPDHEERMARMLRPRMAIDCPALRPDEPIDDYDTINPNDAISAFLQRKRGTGRGASVAVISGVRHLHSRDGRQRSATPSLLRATPGSVAGRYCGGGGGGFFVDKSALSRQNNSWSSSYRPQSAGPYHHHHHSSGASLPPSSGAGPSGGVNHHHALHDAARASRRTGALSSSDDEGGATDEASLAARAEVQRMFGGPHHHPGGDERDAAGSGTTTASEARRAAWGRLRRRLPAPFAAAFESVQRDFTAALEALDDVIAALDLVVTIAPRPASGVADVEAYCVDLPPSFLQCVGQQQHGALCQRSIAAVLRALVLQADGPHAAPISDHDGGGTNAMVCVSSGMDADLLASFAVRLGRASKSQSLANAAATLSGGGVGKGVLFAVPQPSNATEKCAERNTSETADIHVVDMAASPAVIVSTGWAATRARVTHARANACTLRAASFYFELSALKGFLEQPQRSLPTEGRASGGGSEARVAVAALVEAYVSALADVAKGTLEWPPRWAVHVPIQGEDDAAKARAASSPSSPLTASSPTSSPKNNGSSSAAAAGTVPQPQLTQPASTRLLRGALRPQSAKPTFATTSTTRH